MADFNLAVAITLQHEGGYVNNPNDSGGETKYGITHADMPGADIAMLSVIEATNYYREHYWKPLYAQIASQVVATKLFDMGVLFGIGEAAYLLQRALNFAPSFWTKVFDAQSLLATNAMEGTSANFLEQYRTHLRAHALNIANATPTNREFLKGWLNRINS